MTYLNSSTGIDNAGDDMILHRHLQDLALEDFDSTQHLMHFGRMLVYRMDFLAMAEGY